MQHCKATAAAAAGVRVHCLPCRREAQESALPSIARKEDGTEELCEVFTDDDANSGASERPREMKLWARRQRGPSAGASSPSSRGVRVEEEPAEASGDADEAMEARRGAAGEGSAIKRGRRGRRDINRSSATRR
mmetsp:Transcript_6231/g.13679  ORF Transcript_6231/g.13679 Transcript_6231/m.13679 type:complete len:134 (+) Transcript_6231:247-648(+)